jgi:NADH-quinone oxidoreductase subunit A
MTSNYLAAALMILVGVGFALALTAAAKYLGPQRPNKAKDVPYECGSDVIGSPRARFEVKFYQVAIVFLVFDIEVAFLYPWAMALRDLGWNGFVQVLLFMALLLAGYIYVWRKGALDWGNENA